MPKQEGKTDGNGNTGKSKPIPAPVHGVDHHHDDDVVKRDDRLGRFGIAPAKPLWPARK